MNRATVLSNPGCLDPKQLQSQVRPGARCGPNCACTWPKSQRYHLSVRFWVINFHCKSLLFEFMQRQLHFKAFQIWSLVYKSHFCLMKLSTFCFRRVYFSVRSFFWRNLGCLTFQDLKLTPPTRRRARPTWRHDLFFGIDSYTLSNNDYHYGYRYI